MYTPLDEIYTIYNNIVDIPPSLLYSYNCCTYVYKFLTDSYLHLTRLEKLPSFMSIVNAINNINTVSDKIGGLYNIYTDFKRWQDCYVKFLNLYNYLQSNDSNINQTYSIIVHNYTKTWITARALYFTVKNKLNDYNMAILDEYSKSSINSNIDMDIIYKISLLVNHLQSFNSSNKMTIEHKNKETQRLYCTVGDKVAEQVNKNISIYDKMSILCNNSLITGTVIITWMLSGYCC